MARGERFRRVFRLSTHAPDVRRDVEDEIAFYLTMRERELEAEGYSAEEAALRAREAFGDPAQVAAAMRRVTGARVRRSRLRELMGSFVQDFRFGVRALARSRGFAVAAVLTLALGLGANVLVFGLIEAVLLRSPAVRSPETLAAVYTTCRRGDPRCGSSYPDYLDYRDRPGAIADMAAYSRASLTLGDGTSAMLVTSELVTGNYFGLLGVGVARGRALLPEDDLPSGGRVAVLSHEFWRSRMGGDEAVLGGSIRLNGVPYTVVGIAPRSFSGLRLSRPPEVWAPLHDMPALFPSAFDASDFHARGSRWMGLVARLSAGATIERARGELLAVSAQLAREDSAARGPRSVTVDPLDRYVLPAGSEQLIRSILGVLQAVVAVTLLLACANLANLLLARASSRRREFGLRAAIGAGRRRVVRQLLTESLVLALLGGLAGLALAAVGLSLVRGIDLPLGFDLGDIGVGINGRVAAFTAALAVATVVAFGLLPALHASRGDLAGVLREGRDAGPRTSRVLGMLVGVQVGLCVVLLTGAGLFVRALRSQLETDLGFDRRGLALMTLDPSMNQYPPERTAALARDLTARIAALPGVAVASTGMRVPVRTSGFGAFVTVEGYSPAPDEEMRVEFNYIGPDYFRTLRLPLVRGREFNTTDAAGAQRVLVINEEMARAWWPARDPIGGTVTFRGEPHVVVGIARNAAWRGLETGGTAYVYAPLLQNPERIASGMLTVLARTDPARAERLLPELRAELHAFDAALAVVSLTTMEQELATTLSPQRSVARLLSVSAALALLLAFVGIYGVVAFGVSRRRRDFGIRLALGARPAELIALVARGTALPVGAGAAAGIAAAIALSGALRGLIHGVEPVDPLTLGSTVAILAVAATAATLLPAVRAARTDPMEAMRTE